MKAIKNHIIIRRSNLVFEGGTADISTLVDEKYFLTLVEQFGMTATVQWFVSVLEKNKYYFKNFGL